MVVTHDMLEISGDGISAESTTFFSEHMCERMITIKYSAILNFGMHHKKTSEHWYPSRNQLKNIIIYLIIYIYIIQTICRSNNTSDSNVRLRGDVRESYELFNPSN